MVKVWKKEEIVKLLETNRQMVEKSIVKIFEYQTKSEQEDQETNRVNGVGYNGIDAFIMSSFAKQILEGRHLSKKQMEIAQKKIQKYAGQLTKIANNQME